MTDYDPVDLAMLACGWAQGAAETGRATALSVERALVLEDTARVLARLCAEVVQDEWPGEWAYDVAEPLGIWIGRAFGRDDDMPSLVEIEEAARDIVARRWRPRESVAAPLEH